LSDENPFALLTEYELSNLAAHIISARQAEYLHRILAMEVRETRANAWFDVRDKRGDADGYLNDVNRARDAAEAAFEIAIQAGEAADAVALEVHYALVIASFSSRAERMPDNLRVALVDGKFWTAQQALADARRLRFAGERAKALAVLIPSLPAASRDTAIAETLGLVEDNRLYWLVPILAGHLQTADRGRLSEESQRWIDEAPTDVPPVAPIDRSMQARINTVKSCVQDMMGRQDLGTEVLEPLLAASGEAASDTVVSALLDTARSLSAFERRELLGRLAPFIPSGLLPKAAELGYLANDALDVLEACTDLGPFLEEGVYHELRHDLEALPRSRRAAIALAKLAAVPAAPQGEKLRALGDVLATDSVTGDSWEDGRRVESLAILADALDGREGDAALRAAIASAREIENRRYRAEALITIALADRARPLCDQLMAAAYEAAAEQPDPPAMQALRLLKLAQRSRGSGHLAVLSEIERLLALPDPMPEDLLERWPDAVASLVRLVQVQLQAERLAADDVASRIATVHDMFHETDALGRVGLFLSAYVERPAMLRSAARLLADLPPKECGSTMRTALHIIGSVPRLEAGRCVVALSPAIAAAGESEAVVNAIVHSARRVLAWWA
jgi:hypothetical protein